MVEDLKEFTRWLGGLFLFALIIQWVLSITPIGRDDTDNGEWGGGRSGLILKTDDRTGCEYLLGEKGGITPRLNVNGKHMGCINTPSR